MADDKTTKTPEQPVTDSGPGKETPPAPPKEPGKVSVSPKPEKKTEPEVKNPQVSVYNFAEIMAGVCPTMCGCCGTRLPTPGRCRGWKRSWPSSAPVRSA